MGAGCCCPEWRGSGLTLRPDADVTTVDPMTAPVDSSAAETVFTYGSPQLRFGQGAADEIGYDLARLGVRRALVITDPGLETTGLPQRVADQMAGYAIEAAVFAGTRVEPTDESFLAAIEFARETGPWDAYVAVGGGSSIDTAKAVDLMTTNPGELLDYVNPPVGQGRAPVEALLPLIAVPTTTGTGAESTTVCVLDVVARRVKTGISHPALRPMLAVIDPDLTISQPAGVTANSGMDICCHALESYTARPFNDYPRKRPEQRVPYCGSNPIADMWSERALALLATAFRRSVHDGQDREARTDMTLASTFAGLGFGNAGVHIPHANAYPIAGQVGDFHPADYPDDHAMVPHGMAVSLTAPEAFRFTFESAPERHLRAAELLAPGMERPDDPADFLPRALRELMRDIGIPPGIGAVGFDEGDVDGLVEGTRQQQRLLAIAPREPSDEDLATILRKSVQLW